MAIVKSSDIAELFDKIRDQRDAAIARAAQLEAERDEARATCERMNDTIKKIATERGDAREERDEARRQLKQNCELADVENAADLGVWIVAAQSEISNLSGQLHDIWEQHAQQSAWVNLEDETPLGQMLDGIGDEVEP